MNSRRTITFLAFPLMVSCGLLLAGRAARTKVIQASPELQQAQQTPTIEEYQPKSTLVTKEHRVERAKFPFIDIHSHHWNPTPGEVDWLVREMDTINLRVMVNLSGGTGEQLQRTVEAMKGRYPNRFVVFANLSYDDLNTSGYGARAATRLEQDVKNGAQGLKIFKNFGMDLKYSNGERVHVDDPEFDPVWRKCAELKIPVLIHVARGAVGVFRSLGLPQRTLAGVERISGPCAAAGEISAVRNAHRRAQSSLCETPENEFYRRASGVSRQRPGAARQTV